MDEARSRSRAPASDSTHVLLVDLLGVAVAAQRPIVLRRLHLRGLSLDALRTLLPERADLIASLRRDLAATGDCDGRAAPVATRTSV
ncbi:MAG TPA: hypothetical protein VHF25_09225 [Nitriliruptorales bacterium]|nr:hypothetical protein [Nitriliruptorales bacterium]